MQAQMQSYAQTAIQTVIIQMNLELPSEIHDSFEDSSEIDCSDGSLVDTFMDNSLGQDNPFLLLNGIQQPQLGTAASCQLIVDKKEIRLDILPRGTHIQSLKITNPTEHRLQLTFPECPFRISQFGNQVRECTLEGWHSAEISIRIEKKEEEYGDIFQILAIAGKCIDRSDTVETAYVQVQIHYVTPKIKLKFTGGSSLLHGLILNRIAANQLGEYALELIGSASIHKIDCSIEGRGRITVHPEHTVLHGTEPQKVVLKGKKGAIVVRLRETKLCYVFGVQLMV